MVWEVKNVWVYIEIPDLQTLVSLHWAVWDIIEIFFWHKYILND